MTRTFKLMAAAIGLTALLTSCGGQTTQSAAPDAPATGVTVAARQANRRLIVGLAEWSVTPGNRTVSAGPITIVAANEGKTAHDLVIVRTDAGPKELPVAGDRSDESKIKIIGRFQEFKSGEKEKQFALEPGNYLLICNLPTHYELGMAAQLVVE